MKKHIIDSIGDKLTYWNGGFYSNKNDARIWVPKDNPGMGWNLNFGNPKAVLLLLLSLILVFGAIIACTLMFGMQTH